MLSLPTDLIKYNLEFLDIKNICSVSSACKELLKISQSDRVWKAQYKTKWELDLIHGDYQSRLSKSIPKYPWYLLYMCRASLQSILHQYGSTNILEVAIYSGKVELVEALIKYGAEINPQKGCITPLSIAIDNLQYEIMDILLKYGARFEEDLDWPPLSNVIENGDLNIIHIMLKYKIINKRNIISKLYQTVNLCRIDIFEMLLQYNYSNVRRCQEDLLVKCIQELRISMIDILLRNNTDPNFLIGGHEKNGYTPLHIAIEMNNSIMVSLLLNAKADPDMKIDGGPKDGLTPLSIASEQYSINIVHMLLQSGADTNIKKEEKSMLYIRDAIKK
jgi:ankyrin repeat protein